jgi:hypothetical protein
VSDIDTEAVDSLKVLDPNRPIREATKAGFHVAVMLRGAAVCPCKLLKRIRNVCDKQQYEIVAG